MLILSNNSIFYIFLWVYEKTITLITYTYNKVISYLLSTCYIIIEPAIFRLQNDYNTVTSNHRSKIETITLRLPSNLFHIIDIHELTSNFKSQVIESNRLVITFRLLITKYLQSKKSKVIEVIVFLTPIPFMSAFYGVKS